MDPVAALDAAGDAGPRAARRSRRRRTRRRRSTGRTDPAHLQRTAAAAHPPGHRTSTPPRRSRGLVPMAATTPIPRPHQPLPPPSRRTFMIKKSTAGVLTSLLLSPQIVRKTLGSSQLDPILANAKTAGQRRKRSVAPAGRGV